MFTVQGPMAKIVERDEGGYVILYAMQTLRGMSGCPILIVDPKFQKDEYEE